MKGGSTITKIEIFKHNQEIGKKIGCKNVVYSRDTGHVVVPINHTNIVLHDLDDFKNCKTLCFPKSGAHSPCAIGDKIYLVPETNKILEIDPAAIFLVNKLSEIQIEPGAPGFKSHVLNGSNHLLSNEFEAFVLSNDGNSCLQAYLGGISVLSGLYLKISGKIVGRYLYESRFRSMSMIGNVPY